MARPHGPFGARRTGHSTLWLGVRAQDQSHLATEHCKPGATFASPSTPLRGLVVPGTEGAARGHCPAGVTSDAVLLSPSSGVTVPGPSSSAGGCGRSSA